MGLASPPPFGTLLLHRTAIAHLASPSLAAIARRPFCASASPDAPPPDSRQAFDTRRQPNAIPSTVVNSRHARHRDIAKAYQVFQRIERGHKKASKQEFINILLACSSPETLAFGKKVHTFIINRGIDSDTAVSTALLVMYGKCGSIEDARKIFDNMHQRNVVTWTAMIGASARYGYDGDAFKLFHEMLKAGVEPNNVTFISILNACSSPEALALGKQVHELIVSTGIESDVVVGNALVSMYGRCGFIEDAHKMFNNLSTRDVASWNCMIAVYARHGNGKEAFKLLQKMQNEAVKPDKITFISILNACSSPEDLTLGKQVHALIAGSEIESDVVLGTALVSMYGKCGSVKAAWSVFTKMPRRNMVTWNTIIAACARNGNGVQAFEIFQRMQQKGLKPDKITFISILNALSTPEALALGKKIHALIADSRFKSDVSVGNALIGMYGNCGSIEEAHGVFDKMCQREMVSWNMMIGAYAKHGYCNEAFQLFQGMQQQGTMPDRITFINILSACSSPEALALGRQVHALIIGSGFNLDVFVGTALVSMYGKCGSIEGAREAFNKMPQRNVVSWNAMIAACVQLGYFKVASEYFHRMQEEGVSPDKITLHTILNACSSREALALGKHIHAYVGDSEIESDVVIGSALVSMYGKCESIEDSRRVFNMMHQRDLALWNAMIGACARHGYFEEAFKHIQEMQQGGVEPDKITFTSILNACSSPKALALGKEIHALIVESAIQQDDILETALVSMYGRCGSIENARRVFNKMSQRNVAAWTAMIAACARLGQGDEALKLFHEMHKEGVKPNCTTFTHILTACSSPEAIGLGNQVHAQIVDSAVASGVAVGNALVGTYSLCESIEDAQKLFDKMHPKDVVSWNALIAAYAQHGYGKEALQLFHEMLRNGVKPDKITFISILSSCTSLAVLELGKQVHASIVENGMESDAVVGNALINMYGRCGSVENAWEIFIKMDRLDVVSWNAMISACAQNGCGKEALELFSHMQREGMKPDGITLSSLLCACSHTKAVDEGLHLYDSMRQEYGITATVEHCNCIVSLLGHAGRLDEAEDFISKMPCQPNAVTWMTFLASCRFLGCIERGKHAAERALQLDTQ